MNAEIAAKREALTALCQTYGVARLEVFGSAGRGGDFDPDRSDIDFLVTFHDTAAPDLTAFFALQSDLGALFGRRVDLVMPDAVRNPSVRESIERTRERVYGA
ncbi:nucleotidyltransferase domain-containing protein [uncultured Rhodospira sp.]|uniref:nucleotidyltransferase family protein n=1 Tax=uncultured Rhodospira sp. TaxID=1936189 RepID=UPI0026322216|nr:nucleotidyltransferase domain-containing protein [uncultured Rhodospira sp.]